VAETPTRDRYRAYAARIAAVSPTYAAWASSVDEVVAAVLDEVAPTQRQPELAFAVARRLGALPRDPLAFRTLVLEARPAFVAALASATMQANDPRRLAPVVPVLGSIPGSIGLVDVGSSASLGAYPDRVHLTYRTPDGDAVMARPVAEPSIRLTAEVDWPLPGPVDRIDVVARVALDPAPIDLHEDGAFARLVEAVPPEATQRVSLMAEAARVVREEPPGSVRRIAGRVPDDLERALAALPSGCTPVVVTSGTLVYVPGAERQAFVDRVTALGVRWIALERTGLLHGVAATLPASVDADDPDAFATLSLDGRALAVCDAFGTRIRWLTGS
jgi:hypothetical protein